MDLRLTPDDLAAIDAAASAIEIHGNRYNDAMLRMTGL